MSIDALILATIGSLVTGLVAVACCYLRNYPARTLAKSELERAKAGLPPNPHIKLLIQPTDRASAKDRLRTVAARLPQLL